MQLMEKFVQGILRKKLWKKKRETLFAGFLGFFLFFFFFFFFFLNYEREKLSKFLPGGLNIHSKVGCFHFSLQKMKSVSPYVTGLFHLATFMRGLKWSKG